MFCPECGEVIGSGPLDLRRASHGERAGFQHHRSILRLLRDAIVGIRRARRHDHRFGGRHVRGGRG